MILNSKIDKVILGLIIFISLNSCNEESKRESRSKSFFSGYEQIMEQDDEVQNLNFSKNKAKQIDLKKKEIRNFLIMKDFIDTIKYVKLETNLENLIGSIDELYFDDDYIFIVDKAITNTVNIFNSAGQFINRIKKLGKGPGEYSGIDNVAIDYTKKLILVYNMNSRKINYYNYQGKFVKSIRTFFYFAEIKVQKTSGDYVFSTYGAPNIHIPAIAYNYLIVTDSLQNIKAKGIPFTENESELSLWGNFGLHLNNHLITYTPRYSDSIITVNPKNELVANYTFDFGADKIKSENMYKLKTAALDSYLQNKSLLYFNGNFSESSTHLYFNLITDTKMAHGFYDKRTHKSFTCFGLATDNYVVPIFSIPMATFKDWFVGVETASAIVNSKEKFGARIKKDALFANLINSTSENDNPILVFYKMKKL